ncbi:alkaline phosphatase D family protein [Hyphococcus sp.]|uniref:alkaline phosphatase D family protein n=1 Tax=Hyphococcus sp. TaxID=2038636 RepID=UPI003CCBCEB0
MLKSKWLLALSCAAMLSACASDGPRSRDDMPELAARASTPEAPDGIIQAVPMPSAPLDASKTLTRIAFASCAQQNEDQSIWDQIAAENPDLTLYIGDNVYGDVRSNDPALPELKAAYMRLAQSEPFARVRAAAPMLTMWDDHDYGMNDAGGDYEHKAAAEALFEYVWAAPKDDPRRARPGVYGSWTIGEEAGRRVQIIMLDTRYFRSELKPTDEYGARGKERYLPDDDPSKTMLGEAQWRWLADELQKPADLRLLVSSVQVISEGHGWEAWKMLPAERERLYDLINETEANGVVMLTGDRHSAALYRKEGVNDYPLFEATSSSLNLPLRGFLPPGEEPFMEPGPNRLGDMIFDANYGLIEIDWETGAVGVSIRGEDGATVLSESLSLGNLQ